MKKIFMLLVACAAMWCVSCSDDDDNGTPLGGNTGRLVSKIIDANDDGSEYIHTYEYDKQGRLTKELLISDKQGESYTTTYTYKDKICTAQVFDDEELDEIIIYEFNDKGSISSEKSYNASNGNIDMTKPAYTSFYHYDNNNQLIRESGAGNYTFIWNNGNIVTWKSQGGSGDTWEETLTYTQHENKAKLNIDCEIGIGNLYVSKYLVEKDIFESEYDGESSETTYTYKFDKDGYVTKINWHKKVYKANGSLENEYTSTYTIEYFN